MKSHFGKTMFVVCAMTSAITGYAQQDLNHFKYSFGASAGAHTTLARRGPQHETEVSKVNFLHPVSKVLGCDFSMMLDDRWAIGSLFSYEEFDLGYKADLYAARAGLELESGLHGATSIIGFYRVGFHVQYLQKFAKRFSVYGRVAPTVGYLPYSPYLEDTLTNGGRRTPTRQVWYIAKPSEQTNTLKFIASSQIGVLYDLGKHLQIGISVHFQKGFSPIVRDTTTIIRDPLNNPKQVDYWTVVDGSAIGGQFRVNYRF